MFTGIIESVGRIASVESDRANRSFRIESSISHELKVDQSVSHNGACLTVESVMEGVHQVTAIEETLRKTNLGDWQPGHLINLERCLVMNGRLDGHIVQGHVDCTATCVDRREKGGSWEFRFSFPEKFGALLIEKGSICLNGISLTLFNVKKKHFTVAVIPYTFEHTNIKDVLPGDKVNIEFDMIGKYVSRIKDLQSR